MKLSMAIVSRVRPARPRRGLQRIDQTRSRTIRFRSARDHESQDGRRCSSSTNSAVAALGAGVFIATPAAQRLLSGVDHDELWRELEVLLARKEMIETTVEPPAGTQVRLRCQALHQGGELQGAMVEVIAVPPSMPETTVGRRRAGLGDLVGVSTAWQAVVREAHLAA